MPNKKKLENFIDGIWIVEIASGICIFEEIYEEMTKQGISTDLILNFLSALVNFADEVFVGEIKHIKLSNHKIFFDFLEHIMLITSLSDEIDIEEKKVNLLIKRIGKQFNLKYGYLYDQEFWYIDVEKFDSFSAELREILNKEPKSIKMIHNLDFTEKIKKLNESIDKETIRFMKRKQKLEKAYEKTIKKLESKKEKQI
ncbi:MAG: hypothetical protein R6U96_06110 [Promethearchaeia archaeon]